jgi:hypothetical protein
MIRISFVILGLLATLSGFGQKKNENLPSDIKSVVVTEQKFDGSASRTYKDSETYYDKKGNVIEEILYKEGKVDSHFKYQYDANGNKTKEIEINADGKIKKITEYKYEGNLRVEKVVTDDKAKVKSKKTYKYEKF